MNDFTMTSDDMNIQKLENAIDGKRQDVNTLRVTFKVLEAEIEKVKKDIGSLQALLDAIISLTSLGQNSGFTKEDRESIRQQNIALHDLLSEKEIKFIQVTQELNNAENDLEYLLQRLDNQKTFQKTQQKTEPRNKDSKTTSVEEKKVTVEEEKNNPWLHGSFYLFTAVTLMATLAFIASLVPLYVVLLVFSFGLITLLVIGALQLRNDKELSESNFINLMFEVLKILPSILKIRKPVDKE
jgi:hypothetical protein